MKKTQRILMALYVGPVLAALLLVALCETDVLETGRMADNKQAEFVTTTVMELATLAGAYLALRMFKMKVIRHELVGGGAPALLKWGLLRLVLLEVPLVGNTLFYYMYMNPTFGYMAIIMLLCLPFVYPSMSRCMAETTAEEEDA
jgi:hypothetical protein